MPAKYVHDIDYYYQHFAIRLGQRYRMLISKEEYTSLCLQNVDQLYIISSNKRLGYVTFKETRVLVIKCNASRCLNTCLDPGQLWPVPNRYKNKGIDTVQFNTDLRQAFGKINMVMRYLAENSGDIKKMYLERPGDYPEWVYGAAANKYLVKNNGWMAHLVKKLYNEKLKKA